MIKRILPIAILGAAVIFNTGCNSGGSFKKLRGVEYKIVKDVPGKNAAIGDIVTFNIVVKEDTMVLFDSYKQSPGKSPEDRVQDVKGTGQWQVVFPKLSAGDSAVIEVSCDTLLKQVPPGQQQLPPWLQKGKKIVINLSIISIKSMDEYKKEMDSKLAAQGQTDDKTLQDYFAKNNIKAQKTASGLYYTVEKDGSGPTITAGQTVTINYTGRTLNGNIFDSNVDTTFQGTHHPKPFDFTPGTGGVIKGWEEGILLFKKGTKATLYIPSPLAYGPQSPAPAIPANSILIFSIDVLDVKAASNKPAGGMTPVQ
jgi:FKBP-type peptidyl-prolyl cis-trans isomerase